MGWQALAKAAMINNGRVYKACTAADKLLEMAGATKAAVTKDGNVHEARTAADQRWHEMAGTTRLQ